MRNGGAVLSMQILFGILVLVAVAAVLFRRGLPGRSPSTRFKCRGCRHLRRAFDDGVMCGYGSREVFKTAAHIRMCGDWEAEPRR
jgi:hypothetical protein